MGILLFNFLLFLVPIFLIIHRDKSFNINLFLLIVYAFFALTAMFVIDGEIYTWRKFQRIDLSIVPYLFFHICFWIFILPIWRINSNDFNPFLTTQQFNILYYTSSILFIFAILINIKDALSVDDLMDVYLYAGKSRGGIQAWSSNLASVFSIPANILVFYSLSRRKRNVLKALFLLFLIILDGYIRMQNYASRGIAYFLFGDIILSFLLFFNSIDKKIKRFILVIIPLALLGFISTILLISEARFGDKMFVWILSYFSEPFINLGTIFWDSPEFFFGKYTFRSFFDFEFPDSSVPLYLFKTFVGSAYLDFNLVGAIIFLVFFSILCSQFLRNIRNKTTIIPFRDVMVYFIIVRIIFSGVFTFFIFPYYNYFGWIFIYFILLGKYKFVLFKSNP